MDDYYSEIGISKEKKNNNSAITSWDYDYLSNKEKQEFDEKFTSPKNISQRNYYNLLKNKNKKILIATGPAELERHYLQLNKALKIS